MQNCASLSSLYPLLFHDDIDCPCRSLPPKEPVDCYVRFCLFMLICIPPKPKTKERSRNTPSLPRRTSLMASLIWIGVWGRFGKRRLVVVRRGYCCHSRRCGEGVQYSSMGADSGEMRRYDDAPLKYGAHPVAVPHPRLTAARWIGIVLFGPNDENQRL